MAENVTKPCEQVARGGIYIHIPFCLKKCYYCDFYSVPIGETDRSKKCDDDNSVQYDAVGCVGCNSCAAENKEDLRARYTRALLAEIKFYAKKYGKASFRASGESCAAAVSAAAGAETETKTFVVDSIFFGGGTPSLMSPQQIADIVEALRQSFEVAPDSEISMECNPKTLNAENLAGFKAAGVNRLSIGVQSFDDEILEGLGRVHRAGDAVETVKLAREAGFENINIDLMFAVPKQNMDKWLTTVETALSLKPEHISFYSLEIAEGTPFDRMVEAGEIKETPVELDREMYANAMARLAEAGYEHYEISNAALPGKECRHNQKYWHFEDYLGLGPSAHSFVRGIRFANAGNIDTYMSAFEGEELDKMFEAADSKMSFEDADSKKSLKKNDRMSEAGKFDIGFPQCVENCHVNSFEDNVSEYVFTALRTKRGVEFDKFEKVAGSEFWTVFRNEKLEFDEYVKDGYAISDEEHIALTKKGIDISNKIMAIFV